MTASLPTATPANGNVVRINLGRAGVLISVILFGIQIGTIVITSVRTNAAQAARIEVLASEVSRLTETNKELVKSVVVLNTNIALALQRIEVLEQVTRVRGRP